MLRPKPAMGQTRQNRCQCTVIICSTAAGDAAEAARRAIPVNPLFSINHMCLVAALSRLAQTAEAKSVAARLLELQPSFSISRQCATRRNDADRRGDAGSRENKADQAHFYPRLVGLDCDGREGMSGLAVVLDGGQSPHSTYIQVAGEAQQDQEAKELRNAMNASATLRAVLLNVFMVQTAHSHCKCPCPHRSTSCTLAFDDARPLSATNARRQAWLASPILRRASSGRK